MTPEQIKAIQESFAKVGADIRAGGGAVLRPLVRDDPGAQAAVSGRHERAGAQADGDARRRGQQSEQSRRGAAGGVRRWPSATWPMA